LSAPLRYTHLNEKTPTGCPAGVLRSDPTR
jgi:hypothetical protein